MSSHLFYWDPGRTTVEWVAWQVVQFVELQAIKHESEHASEQRLKSVGAAGGTAVANMDFSS